MTDGTSRDDLRASSIAIIGLAGRFPGASDIETYWKNLVAGIESITFFSDEELLREGVDPELIGRKDFVKASPVLDDVDKFDAAFFKIAKREAEIMDPQQRILLEIAWEALERAGYAGESQTRSVGVFAGAGGMMSSYLLSPYHLCRRLLGGTGSMQAVGNDKDYVATRISHKLNLCGPSLTVQTACSTSLVAVHLACQSLLAGECEMALAGGVTVRVPHRIGYLHSAQALLSPDGHWRAFDADAKGTLFGSGAGLVLLKPLVRAVEDGDHIHAVIRGSAVNNDGGAKLSYWATSAEGQAAAVSEALAVAETEPESITFIEAHGTGTSMGDPVEIFALTKAFRAGTDKTQFCAIGSVKTNLGHLEAAAGVAGLIKAVLALENQEIPPSLHYRHTNPAIHFEKTPFYVVTQRQDWPAGTTPRRAAVNSLGIGGTNAHVVLEEAPPPYAAPAAADRPLHVLALSAKTPAALTELAGRFVRFMAERPDVPLADVAFTANTGRGHFKHRLAVVAASADEARQRLAAWVADPAAANVFCHTVDKSSPDVAMFFGGEGSGHAGPGRELYRTQPVFQKAVHQCNALAPSDLGLPILAAFEGDDGDGKLLQSHVGAQLSLFALEYALAQLWKSWGITPTVVAGEGLGEYAAACLAGVFTLEQAMRMVVARAGLAGEGRLPAGDAADEQFQSVAGAVGYRRPRMKVLCGWSGQPAGDDVATPDYWRRHLVEPGRPGATMAALQQSGQAIVLDVGLGSDQSAWHTMIQRLASLYARGVKVDWAGFDRGWTRRRVVLPTYPFQRQRYWLADDPKDRLTDVSGDNGSPSFLQLLREGNLDQLAEALRATGSLSDDELGLLPKLLRILADRQRSRDIRANEVP